MAINDRVETLFHLLDKVRSYDRIVTSDSFEPSTIEDMKGNAKELCNLAKTEIDQIKLEIENWS